LQPAVGRVKIDLLCCGVKPVFDIADRALKQCPEARSAELFYVFVRVLAFGQSQHPCLNANAVKYLHRAVGRLFAGCIGVKRYYYLFGVSAEQPRLLLGKRCAERRDRVAEACLMQAYNINIALYKYHLL